jgi:hypothetical protein
LVCVLIRSSVLFSVQAMVGMIWISPEWERYVPSNNLNRCWFVVLSLKYSLPDTWNCVTSGNHTRSRKWYTDVRWTILGWW